MGPLRAAMVILGLAFAAMAQEDLPCPPNSFCPTAAAPYQCFVADGSTSRCCPTRCLNAPPTDPAQLCASGTPPTLPATPGMGPSPYPCTPRPSPSPTPLPSPVPNPNCPSSSAPNQCFVADGSTFRCCAGLCTTPPPANVAQLCGGVAAAAPPTTVAAAQTTTPAATVTPPQPAATTPPPVATAALAATAPYPPAPTRRSPVVNPFATGQLCPGGKAPLTCPTTASEAPCRNPCLRYPTAQCVADTCDNCTAKYNLNVGLPGDFVGWEVNCTCPGEGIAPFGSAYTLSTPTPCKPDPCANLTCPAAPDAFCVTDTCGGCSAIFLKNGVEVNCGRQTRFLGANVTSGALAPQSSMDITNPSPAGGVSSQQGGGGSALAPGANVVQAGGQTTAPPTAPPSGASGLHASWTALGSVAAALVLVVFAA